MELRIAQFNILDAFSKEAQIKTVVNQIDGMDADIAVFTEAYAEGQEQFLDEVCARFAALGYVASRTLYDDDDDRLDRHGLLMINRLNGAEASPRRLGSRTALLMPLAEGIDVLGMHADDRSERRRFRQVEAALGPAVIAGDFNSVTRRVPFARATTLLPAHFPTPERPSISKWERACNIAHRLGAMTASRVHQTMEAGGYKDPNVRHHATWPSPRPFLELDRIMVQSSLRVTNFQVYDPVPELDHLPIAASIEV